MSYSALQTPTGEGEARQAATQLLGSRVAGLSRLTGGGNNRLFRVEAEDGRLYALKSYMQSRYDRRDRLGAEYSGLGFLWRHGLRQIPRPVACDRERGLALYEWVEGCSVAAASDEDIESCIAFLVDLHRLMADSAAPGLPLASEACLSAAELVRQIEHRAARLRAVDDMSLRLLLAGTFADLHDRHIDAAVDGYEALGFDFDAPLPERWQTLSPSDFGLHNALRRPDGTLAFIDFEYFGRDDPVKLTADFLLHPGMRLEAAQKRHFFRQMRQVYGADPAFTLRFRLLFPLYGLRWAMILLNAFLPERWQRMAYADAEAERDAVQRRQLAKARDMLDYIQLLAREFPYDA